MCGPRTSTIAWLGSNSGSWNSWSRVPSMTARSLGSTFGDSWVRKSTAPTSLSIWAAPGCLGRQNVNSHEAESLLVKSVQCITEHCERNSVRNASSLEHKYWVYIIVWEVSSNKWLKLRLKAPYYMHFRIFIFHPELWWTSLAQLITPKKYRFPENTYSALCLYNLALF